MAEKVAEKVVEKVAGRSKKLTWQPMKKIKFYLDSGATNHMVNNINLYERVEKLSPSKNRGCKG